MRILQDNLCISKMMLLKTDMFNNKPVQIYLEGIVGVYYTDLLFLPLYDDKLSLYSTPLSVYCFFNPLCTTV